MTGRRHLIKLTALSMIVVTTAVSTPTGLAGAALVETEDVISQRTRDADRARVVDFLLREDVREHLTRLGVDPNEAAARVAALSDAELREISGRLDTLPAGQIHGPLIAAAVITFLVLLFLDLFGVIDVFPFINPIDGKAKR